MQATPPTHLSDTGHRKARLRQLWSWTLPVLLLLAAALTLRLNLHARWLDLVWSVRGLDDATWSSGLTRLRLGLDGVALGLGALAAALTLRLEAAWDRWLLAGLLAALGALSSDLIGGLGALAAPLCWAALAGLGVLTVLGGRWGVAPARRWGVAPARRWGELALLIGLTVFLVGRLPGDLAGHLALFGSDRLGVWWNELGRPLARDLGFVAFLLGAGLSWLEHRPGALRSGLARGAVLVGLAAFTALVYVGVVGGVGSLLGRQDNLWLGMTAAALIAVGFGRVRSALGRGVQRLLYGARDDPFAVTRQLALILSQGPDPQMRLDTVLELLTRGLRLPGAVLQLVGGETITRGEITGALERWPLAAGGERVGTLLVARRSPNEALSKGDHELLDTVAGQLADAAHTWQLSEALLRSRERLVRAGEDERRRLRRDLHDGLGPALSGLGLKLEAARLLIDRAPERAGAQLATLQLDVRESVNEVRRLVHDLRPPKLDDLGLLGALDELLSNVEALGLTTRFERPAALPPLSAAAEVALYRIAQEALTNVVKHAGARCVTLRLEVAQALTLDVQDDGVGLPELREPGVGSRSMRERAEALSGTLTWQAAQGGGTLVRASLPSGAAPD